MGGQAELAAEKVGRLQSRNGWGLNKPVQRFFIEGPAAEASVAVLPHRLLGSHCAAVVMTCCVPGLCWSAQPKVCYHGRWWRQRGGLRPALQKQ